MIVFAGVLWGSVKRYVLFKSFFLSDLVMEAMSAGNLEEVNRLHVELEKEMSEKDNCENEALAEKLELIKK